jgi:uncharacterized protein YidB (DUF937 family)
MGLLDVLTGMRNGPRGSNGGGGGMSPITMALLGLLAYKAVKSFGGATPRTGSGMATPGGGLGDLLKGGLGGAGKGDVADSRVSTGQNKPIAPADLSKVLTP